MHDPGTEINCNITVPLSTTGSRVGLLGKFDSCFFSYIWGDWYFSGNLKLLINSALAKTYCCKGFCICSNYPPAVDTKVHVDCYRII